MYRLICQKPAHFLSAQLALVSTFFQMFIVLGMYNIDMYLGTEVRGDFNMEPDIFRMLFSIKNLNFMML